MLKGERHILVKTDAIGKAVKYELAFLKSLIARPGNVGAIAPSSPALARAIAAQIDPSAPGNVLELGPGTGVVTEAIMARGIAVERIIAVEYDRDLAAVVSRRFPGARVIVGDAFELAHTLGHTGGPFAAIVSGLPLLNHPMARRQALIESAMTLLAPRAPFVQFSYGLNPPVPANERFTVTRAAFVLANIPPARVWVYRCTRIPQ